MNAADELRVLNGLTCRAREAVLALEHLVDASGDKGLRKAPVEAMRSRLRELRADIGRLAERVQGRTGRLRAGQA